VHVLHIFHHDEGDNENNPTLVITYSLVQQGGLIKDKLGERLICLL
jgi:hypothetical protein